jgi:hypothetical protein
MTSMTSSVAAPSGGRPRPPDRFGAQRPRIYTCPDYVSTTGPEAIELAEMAGLILDPWQQFVITESLGEQADGRWGSMEIGLEVARQNGKGGVLEARELAGLFLLGERLIIHSAHEFATAIKAFERMLNLLEACPDFSRRLKSKGGVTRSHGFEGIHLKGGQSLEYRTRTKGGGRGFSCDCLILDEAMHLPEEMHSTLFPTMTSRPNPQIFYTGSAVDQQSMKNGVVFARLRKRALDGNDPTLAYFGWSPALEHPDQVTEAVAADPDVWAQSNPALGFRITEQYIAAERRALGARGFAVERLSVGDWPDPEDEVQRKISADAWKACTDIESAAVDPVFLTVDVTEDRAAAAIAVAGWRADGLAHVESLPWRQVDEVATDVAIGPKPRGTAWLKDRLPDLCRRHDVVAVLFEANSPAASVIAEISDLGVELIPIKSSEHAQACGMLVDGVAQLGFRHLGTPELEQALKGAATRPLGDSWAWARRASSNVDVSPLVAVTLAHWALKTKPLEAKAAFDPDDYRITSA